MEIINRKEKPFGSGALEGGYALTEVFIQQLTVRITFPGDAEGVVVGEIDEPFAWDDFKVMGFGNLEPAAVDPAADGFVFVAEDGFYIFGRDDVGQVVPLIVEPQAEVFGGLDAGRGSIYQTRVCRGYLR